MHHLLRIVIPVIASLFLLLVPLSQSLAQTTPFLSDDEISMLADEISGDRSFEHIRWLSHWHRIRGSKEYFKSDRHTNQPKQIIHNFREFLV